MRGLVKLLGLLKQSYICTYMLVCQTHFSSFNSFRQELMLFNYEFQISGNNTLVDWNDWKDGSSQDIAEEPAGEEADFFQDMEPTLTKPRVVRISAIVFALLFLGLETTGSPFIIGCGTLCSSVTSICYNSLLN